MDRRQKKSRDAIFQSFSTLLEKNRYETITVQNIIDLANVGRSTFYAHFETKDQLLKAMCTEVFTHVFSKELKKEDTHDFSEDNGIEGNIAHILYHFKENRKNVTGVLSCESGNLFMGYFHQYLEEMFSVALKETPPDVPRDYILNYLVGTCSETVMWWIGKDMGEKPEQVAGYFMKTVTEGINFNERRRNL